MYIEESMGILDEEGGDLFFKDIKKEVSSLKEDIENIELRTLL